MSDVEFDFMFIPNRYVDRVQRAAVLYPLTKKCLSVKQVKTQVGVIQRMWRARVGALTDHGWLPQPSRYSIGAARNCLPTFLYSLPRTRPCHAVTICPFCYARWVREIWLTVDQSFPNPLELNADNRHDGSLIEYADTDTGLPQNGLFNDPDLPANIVEPVEPKRSVKFKFHAVEFIYQYLCPYPENVATQQTYLHQILTELVVARKNIVKQINPSAAFIYDTVEPALDGWKIRSRHLLRIKPGHVLPANYGLQPGARLTIHENPTRKVLFGAVARVCRYPKLLIHGDPALTAMLLTLRQSQRFRMAAMYRGFRGRID